MSERNAAALFLLTADEGLWQRVLWHFDSSGFDFPAIRSSTQCAYWSRGMGNGMVATPYSG